MGKGAEEARVGLKQRHHHLRSVDFNYPLMPLYRHGPLRHPKHCITIITLIYLAPTSPASCELKYSLKADTDAALNAPTPGGIATTTPPTVPLTTPAAAPPLLTAGEAAPLAAVAMASPLLPYNTAAALAPTSSADRSSNTPAALCSRIRMEV